MWMSVFVQNWINGFGRRQQQQKNGGSDRDRTGYLLVANEALSQMSYGPTRSIIILTDIHTSTNKIVVISLQKAKNR